MKVQKNLKINNMDMIKLVKEKVLRLHKKNSMMLHITDNTMGLFLSRYKIGDILVQSRVHFNKDVPKEVRDSEARYTMAYIKNGVESYSLNITKEEYQELEETFKWVKREQDRMKKDREERRLFEEKRKFQEYLKS